MGRNKRKTRNKENKVHEEEQVRKYEDSIKRNLEILGIKEVCFDYIFGKVTYRLKEENPKNSLEECELVRSLNDNIIGHELIGKGQLEHISYDKLTKRGEIILIKDSGVEADKHYKRQILQLFDYLVRTYVEEHMQKE